MSYRNTKNLPAAAPLGMRAVDTSETRPTARAPSAFHALHTFRDDNADIGWNPFSTLTSLAKNGVANASHFYKHHTSNTAHLRDSIAKLETLPLEKRLKEVVSLTKEVRILENARDDLWWSAI